MTLSAVSHEEVARTYLDVRGQSGDELLCLCPVHDDSSPSMCFNIKKGLWTCYACGAGGSTKKLLELLGVAVVVQPGRSTPGLAELRAAASRLLASVSPPRCSCASVYRELRSQKVHSFGGLTVSGSSLQSCTTSSSSSSSRAFIVGASSAEDDKRSNFQKSKYSSSFLTSTKKYTGNEPGRCKVCNLPLVLEESYLRKYQVDITSPGSSNYTNFLVRRNISVYDGLPSTTYSSMGKSIKNYSSRVIFSLGWSSLTRSITIPYRDRTGLLLGVVHRRLTGRPKYVYPRNFPRTENLFASWLLEEDLSGLRTDVLRPGSVVLVEGSLDAVKVWQAGLPAVAMWGSRLHEKQVQILKYHGITDVVVFTDRDSAGRSAAVHASQMLSRASMGVRVVRYPASYPQSLSDPGALPETLIRSRVLKAKRYSW